MSLEMSLLRYLYREKERINENIEEYLRKNIYRDVAAIRGTFITKNNIAKVIEEVLGRSKKTWFDFVISLQFKRKSGIVTKNVFIIGEKNIICNELEEISENVFNLNPLKEYCLWIGLDSKLKPEMEELID